MMERQVNNGDEKTITNTHVLSGIRIHGLSAQAIKTAWPPGPALSHITEEKYINWGDEW
jgi:hypothetical protein